ncbi:MAG: hypothetical protein J4473_02045 [Candidatus Aenigmarchaeota archaeon]|nr:hypothetical protein [Candidatus Aenigmarchaeota archaeon]
MNEDRFIHVYVNLPFKVREEIVVVIDGEPVSWSIAYQEIKHNTEKSKRIIKKLIRMGII